MTVIEEEKLVENAEGVGEFVLARLRDMQERYPFIGNVQGKGLAIGVGLVKDRVTREPLDKAVCVRMFQEGLRRGLISMVYNPHFRINPALSIDRATAETGLGILDEVFGLVARERSWQ